LKSWMKSARADDSPNFGDGQTVSVDPV
jgi:hypothetical protein